MSKIFAITRGQNVENLVVSEAPLVSEGEVWVEVTDMVPRPDTSWKYVSGNFVSPHKPDIVLPDAIPQVISKVAFRFRLTDAEYVGIISAAKTDAEVTAWVETFNMVTQIDLNAQRTKDGVANLVSKNLLTQERATEILTTPVQDNERL